MRDLRSAKVLVLGALAMVLLLTTNFSTAAFTSSSTSTASVRAAADWTPPQAQLLAPFALVRGVTVLTASATDGESSIADLAVQRSPEKAETWSSVCARPSASYACSWDTTTVPDGRYDVRATATDAAGYTGSSTPATVTVDNTAPTVRLLDPGTPLSGTRTFATSDVADATSGVARVEVQRAPRGTDTWTTVCTTTAAPWSCAVDTTATTDGRYDFRAVATDTAGNRGISAVIADRVVANGAPVAPFAPDVQASNGGVVSGLIETGDSLTLTYSCRVDLGTIRAGWTGAPTDTLVTLRDIAEAETLELGPLGVVRTNGDFSKKDRVLEIPSTMSAGLVTVDGQLRTAVTLTFGQLPSGSNGTLETVRSATTLTWAPANVVRNLAGQTCTAGTVTETGTADVDF